MFTAERKLSANREQNFTAGKNEAKFNTNNKLFSLVEEINKIINVLRMIKLIKQFIILSGLLENRQRNFLAT